MAALLGSCLATLASASSPTDVAALQQLGARVKQIVDSIEGGHTANATEIAGLQRALSAFNAAPDDRALVDKRAAVARLVAKLTYLVAHPAAVPVRARRSVDVQQLTPRHGDRCASALGLTPGVSVHFTLAAGGETGSTAWFRVETTFAEHHRFSTDSSASDPSLEVFANCADSTAPVAANDDTLGLDAAVVVDSPPHTALFVRVINSGRAGTVTLEAQEGTGTIKGSILDADTGQPLENAEVILFGANGTFVLPIAYSDANGAYEFDGAPGNYYVRAGANAHVAELYPDAACSPAEYLFDISSCAGGAQLVSLADGAVINDINFTLATGHRIGGVVRDAGGQGVQGSVTLYDSGGNEAASTGTDAFGRYYFATIPPSTYKLVASANGYGAQWYNHVACSGPLQNQCAFAQGNAIVVDGSDLMNLDFSLPALAAISGTIADSALQPLHDYYTMVAVMNGNGETLNFAYPDANGHYRVGPFAPGTYYAYASSPGHVSQLYSGVNCANPCSPATVGVAPIVINQGQKTFVADFALLPLPIVQGHVQDSISGLPLRNVQVLASSTPPANFISVSSTLTDAAGNYVLQNTPVGSYYLWAQSVDHIDAVYPGLLCEAGYSNSTACDVTGATLLKIVAGQTPADFNFVLPRSSSISGNVLIDAGPGSDLPAMTSVDVFDSAGIHVATTTSDASGNYVVIDLPPGIVYATGGGYYWWSYDYASVIWPSTTCMDSCVPTTGTPISVPANANVGGINFRLAPRHAIVGRITDNFGTPVVGALIDLFDASTAHVATGASDVAGYYAASFSAGASTFYVATDADGYVNEIYSGIACIAGPAYFGVCPFTGATLVPMPYQNTTPRIVNFALKPDAIFGSGFE